MDAKGWTTFWTVCYTLVAVLIIVGNVLSVSVLLRRKLRKRPHFLLISLAFTDLLVGLFAVPMYIFRGIWGQNQLSMFFDCVDIFTGLTSMFTLAVISLERLNAITRPLRHRQLTYLSYSVAIATPWIVSFMVTSTRVLFQFFIITAKQFFTVTIISLATPLLIACAAYYVIYRQLASRIHNEVQVRKEAKLSRALFMITALFVLTWLPFPVLTIVAYMCLQCKHIPVVTAFVVKLLQYSNSFLNVVVYYLKIPDFRRVLSQMVPTCKLLRKKRGVIYPLRDDKKGVSLVSFTSLFHLQPSSDDTA